MKKFICKEATRILLTFYTFSFFLLLVLIFTKPIFIVRISGICLVIAGLVIFLVSNVQSEEKSKTRLKLKGE